MTATVAIVGDIHGNIQALRGMLQILRGRRTHLVFVGDYINRGPNSKEVIDTLIEISAAGDAFFISGNHDQEFLNFLQGGDLAQLLRMGGAATVRSYLPEFEGADLAQRFRSVVPPSHAQFLRALSSYYLSDGLLVTHGPAAPLVTGSFNFHVYGHRIQQDCQPRMDALTAAIDTGCGSLENGRLTALLWPSCSVLQVDRDGHQFEDP